MQHPKREETMLTKPELLVAIARPSNRLIEGRPQARRAQHLAPCRHVAEPPGCCQLYPQSVLVGGVREVHLTFGRHLEMLRRETNAHGLIPFQVVEVQRGLGFAH